MTLLPGIVFAIGERECDIRNAIFIVYLTMITVDDLIFA